MINNNNSFKKQANTTTNNQIGYVIFYIKVEIK